MKPPKNEFAIRDGELRSVVQVQVVSSTQDGSGQPIQTWTTLLTAFAKIDAIADGEALQVGALTSRVTHEIYLKYPWVSVSPGMRVVYQSHYYKVQTVENPKERNRLLKLRCLEINATE